MAIMAFVRVLPPICTYPTSRLATHKFKCFITRPTPSSCSHSVFTSSSHMSPLSKPVTSPSFDASPFSGLEDVMMGYVFGKKKATEVVHSSWKHVLRKGDMAIDATCGNGHDTVALLRMLNCTTDRGRVYAMDIQEVALESTSHLLEQSVTQEEKACVELFLLCHSKMEEVVPSGVSVRLVAFNLGYLPGGQKILITRSGTTLAALQAAERVVGPGGLITIVAYVGHQGGREELDTVQAFASKLPVENWTCCKLETLNRPFAPVIIFLHRK